MSRRRDEAGLWRDLDRMRTPARRTSLPGVLWHWRKELTLLTLLAIMAIAVASSFGFPWLIVGLSMLAGALSPPWSAPFRAWLWQLVTPHLLRSGMFHARIQNRYGRRPMIMRVTREAFGERVLLRCPVGLCAEDIEDEQEMLRAACRAADIRVTRDELRAHLVTVDVIRRPAAARGTRRGYPDGTSTSYPDHAGSRYPDHAGSGYPELAGGR
jgi:hypothetical protein